MIDMIVERYWKGHQSLRAEMVFKRVDGLRFKMEVTRDSYDFQSSIHASVWGERGWELVVSKPIEFTCVKKWSYVQFDNEQWKVAARKDMDDIYEEASEIVPMHWGKRR